MSRQPLHVEFDEGFPVEPESVALLAVLVVERVLDTRRRDGELDDGRLARRGALRLPAARLAGLADGGRAMAATRATGRCA